MHDGNVRRRIDELAVAGKPELVWQRYHNSIPRTAADFDQKTLGTAGSWRSNWQYDLIEETDPKTGRATFELIYPSGTRRMLFATKSKLLSAPRGMPERGRLANGGVQVTLENNAVVFFKPRAQANRKPRYEAQHLTMPSGEVYIFSRDTRGRLVQVRDLDGSWIRMGYQTVPLQTNPLVNVGEVSRAPARGKWLELPLAQTGATARVLNIRLQVPAQTQIAEVEFYAAGSNTPISATAYRGIGVAAMDRSAGTVYSNPNKQDSVLLRFDLPLGSNFKLEKVRLLAPQGAERQLIGTQVKIGLVQPQKRSLAVITSVKTSSGLALTYEYEKLPWTSGVEQLALVRARYGDGTVANYRYSGRDTKLGPRPLLVQADDPRYGGRAKQIAYEYHAPITDRLKAGTIKAEKNPVTGVAWARLEFPSNDPQKRLVHYSDDRAIVFRLHSDGSGRVTERTDSLGRTTAYKYSNRNQGPAHAVRDPQGKVTAYTNNDRGRAIAVKQSHEPRARKPAGAPAKAATKAAAVSTGNSTFKRSASGQKVELQRNRAGLVERMRFADGSENTFSYDVKGRIVRRSEGGRSHTFTYDRAGRRSTETDGNGNVVRYDYDVRGHLASVRDALGRTTQYQHDELGRPVTTTFPDGTQQTVTRDAYGRIVGETDRDGRKASYAYDILGRKTRETDFAGLTTQYEYSELPNGCGSCTVAERPTRIVHPDGRTTRLLYDTEGRLLAMTLNADTPHSATTTFTYDKAGRQTSLTRPDGSVMRNTYNARGHLVAATDASGRKTTYETNVRGERVSATDAAGRVTRWTYRGGQVASEVSAEGVVTRYRRDASGRVRETRRYLDAATAAADAEFRLAANHPRLVSTRYAYDAAGHVVQEIDAESRVLRHSYDVAGRRTSTEFSDGRRQTWEYDAVGRITKTSTADGLVTRFTYDARDRVLSESDSAGRSTTYRYDTGSNRVTVRDPLGRETATTYVLGGKISEVVQPDGRKSTNAYDTAGRLISTTDTAGNTTHYSYDVAGNRAQQTDSRGNTYRFTYDSARRLTSTSFPDGTVEKLSYNAAGQVTRYINRAGQTKTIAYDATGRILSESWVAGSNPAGLVVAPAIPLPVSYSYDTAGRLASIDNGLVKLSYVYDGLGRMQSEALDTSRLVAGVPSATVGFTYDRLGRASGLIYPDRTGVSYDYDARGRAIAVRDLAGKPIAEYDYDSLGRVTKLTRDGNLTTSYGHDQTGRLTDVVHRQDGQVLASARYVLDALGRRTTKTREDGAVERFGYDPIGQLTLADYGGGKSEEFAYDRGGNRSQVRTLGAAGAPRTETYAVNALNQYSGLDLRPLIYDANGNLTDDGERRYRYDALNRLVAVEPSAQATGVAATVRAEFFHDARNRCVLRKYYSKGSQGQWMLNTTDSRVLSYDNAWNVVAERTLDGRAAGCYVHGFGVDEILRADLEQGASQESIYPLADGLGSTVALVDRKRNVVQRFRYDAFGTPLVLTENYHAAAGAASFRFLFTGREWLAPVQLNDHRRRHYMPSIGRWMSPDPIGFLGGRNLYAYAANMPTTATDAHGLLEPGTTVVVTSTFVTSVTSAPVGATVTVTTIGTGAVVVAGAAAVISISGYGYWQLGTLAGEWIVTKMGNDDDYPSCDFAYMVAIPGDPCRVQCFYMCYTPHGLRLTQGPNGAAKEGCGARITNPWRPRQ